MLRFLCELCITHVFIAEDDLPKFRGAYRSRRSPSAAAKNATVPRRSARLASFTVTPTDHDEHDTLDVNEDSNVTKNAEDRQRIFRIFL